MVVGPGCESAGRRGQRGTRTGKSQVPLSSLRDRASGGAAKRSRPKRKGVRPSWYREAERAGSSQTPRMTRGTRSTPVRAVSTGSTGAGTPLARLVRLLGTATRRRGSTPHVSCDRRRGYCRAGTIRHGASGNKEGRRFRLLSLAFLMRLAEPANVGPRSHQLPSSRTHALMQACAINCKSICGVVCRRLPDLQMIRKQGRILPGVPTLQRALLATRRAPWLLESPCQFPVAVGTRLR